MTLETACLIELSDVLGLEFECQKCKARITFDTRTAKGVLGKCPACFEKWVGEETEEYSSLTHLLGYLKSLDTHLKGHNLKVRLRVPLSAAQKSEGRQ